MIIQAVSVLLCLLVAEDMAEDKTVQMKGSWWLINTTHLYTNKKKTLRSQFTFDAATV